MNFLKKVVSILLAIVIIFSFSSILVSAANEKTQSDKDFENLEKDIPMIVIPGLGGQFYKGISTETEDDDVQIWEPTMEILEPVIKKQAFPLVTSILTKNYKKANDIIEVAASDVFKDFACSPDGVPNSDTGKKNMYKVVLQNGNGYTSRYTFEYDWRKNITTLADELEKYINDVMAATGAKQVSLVGMSLGGSVLMTYLYNICYNNPNYANTNHIHSVTFIASSSNGTSSCEDPFSCNINLSSETIVQYVEKLSGGRNEVMRALYLMGVLDMGVNFANGLITGLKDNGLYDSVEDSLATIPGFHALMSKERYEDTVKQMYNTPEKQKKFAKIIESGDFYHYDVQQNNVNILNKLKEYGARIAVIAEYGYNLIPITADNTRLSDGTVAVKLASFGATCTATDEVFDKNYVQAVNCPCGKNHISPDGQIDASSCAFADVTWFCKDLFHVFDDSYFEKLLDLIAYSQEPVDVHTYNDLPQFLLRDGDNLIPLTKENAGETVNFKSSIASDDGAKKLATKIKIIIAVIVIVLLLIDGLIIFVIVKTVKKIKVKRAAKQNQEQPKEEINA